jgi:hypothetical protein
MKMTDVSKAVELLELEEKWLELFDVTDPFSNLQLEGYLSLKPDYRYGALALLKVGGQEVPQRILATPKLHYPFDRNVCSKSEARKRHSEFWLLQNCITLLTGTAHFTFHL